MRVRRTIGAMNVVDCLRDKDSAQIVEYCKNNSIPAYFAMMHIEKDFNLSCLHRCANFFGFRATYYVGGSKQWDRRGSVGTHHYTNIVHVKTEDDFIRLCENSGIEIVAVENNAAYADKTRELFANAFDGLKNPVFLFGEEKSGLSDKMLAAASRIVYIRGYGSVRSLNVAVAGGIIAANFRNYYENNR